MKIYFLREGLLQSIVADTYTLIIILAGAWVNKFWLGDSAFFNGIFAVMFMFWLFSRAANKPKKFTSKRALIAHLQEVKAND
jgi:hypothetical protein